MSAGPRRTQDRGDLRALAILIALGLGLRLLIVYVIPGSGFRGDLASFQAWAMNLAAEGPWGFYERPFLHDYPPGYMYILWVAGELRQALAPAGGFGDWIKLPAIVADLVLAWLVHSMILELGASRRRALAGAAIVLFIPITWFDSVVWGQVDAVGVVFMVLGLRSLWRDEPEKAALWSVIAAIIKPQLGILVPIVAGVTIARYLFPRDREDDSPAPVDPDLDAPFGSLGRWFARERGPVRILTTGLVGLLSAVVLAAPFKLSIIDLVRQIGVAAGGYPYLTVNAYNLWALVQHDGNSMANNWAFQCDAIASAGSCVDPAAATLIGPFWAVAVGTTLLLVAIAAITVLAARHPSRLTLLVALAALALAFFVVPTRVHERYLFPLVPLAAILAVLSARWAIAGAVTAVATFLNMYVVLTTVYGNNPQISDWFGIGLAIRSETSVTLIALAQTGVFLFALGQLRGTARRRLAAEAALAGGRPREPAMPGSAPDVGAVPAHRPQTGGAHPGDQPAPVPGVSVGLPFAGLVARLHGRPLRPDRSRAHHGEPPGRFDRLDVVLVVLVVVGCLFVRLPRLDQPQQKMFDEIYHVRTATEFLQFWRYGEPHRIYEYTHPHLAKYAIAAGLVTFSGDRVTGTSELGVGARDAAIEVRYDDPLVAGGRGGDRLHVATGDAVQVFDLATRAPVATVPWPGAGQVAIDRTGHRLYVAADDGRIGMLDTAATLDPLRDGAASVETIEPEPLLDVGASIVTMHATADGRALFVGTADGEVVAIDPLLQAETGRVRVDGVAAIADAGDSEVLVGRPADVPDVAAAAATMAELLGGIEDDYLALLAGDEQVTLGAVDAAIRSDVQAAIDDGRLEGMSIETEQRVAAAGQAGVTFLSAASGGLLSEIPTDLPATGLALVTGIDAGSDLYVATGSELARISVDRGQAPTEAEPIWMPATVSDVRYNTATELVHVLGARQDGSGATVYTVEPHGNAVFADIPLPFEPATWVTDDAQPYPATDRSQLLAIEGDGTVATADIGDYAKASRLPGVLAGAIMGGLLYALARILFRRRSVALATAAFVLAEGMLFTQSRIAMNDVYVGLFIVAAYVVLAWLLVEPARRARAFWIALPIVGILLGLALSAKWVGAYAIAGAVVLVLARSALGRILVIGGLILATIGLGTLAVSVPAGPTSGPNWTFFLIMVALTLLAVVVTVARPVAWSVDEIRFAIGAPVVAGAAVWGVGVLAGFGEQAALVGLALLATGAAAYGAFVVGRFFGVGPLARSPRAGDAAAWLPPASPPPAAWLRLGSSMGLPAVWGAISLLVVPIAVYVASFLPWVALGNRLVESWPANHTGETLLALTQRMYDYHDTLRAAHAAYSPWWAWPFDLKPVWFYSASYASDTAAAVYGAGSLVIFWLGVVAIAFTAWQAWARRSPALAILVIAFAWQWLPWARIDRGTYQYHYYTALPFVVIALGYLAAELWHGPSRRTWLGIRIAAAIAIVAPALMWLGRGVVCSVAGVERARPNSEACAPNPGTLSTVITFLGEGPAAFLRAMPPEAIALFFLVPLAVVAWFVLTARDARRFVGGMVVAAMAWILVWYPNIASLPLPARVYNAYQGVLPTWVWSFQFPVNLDPATEAPALLTVGTLVLLGALTATCLIVAYAAWSWRLATAQRGTGDPDASFMEGGPAPGSG